jgi:uncharacterized protein YecE (DUF72 family)
MSRLLPGFESDGERPPLAGVLGPRLRSLAERGIYFGGSSWKYEGWLGSIYQGSRYLTRGKFSKKKFDEGCLREYAETFPTVCGDFAFYQFPSEKYWAKLFAEVPRGFLFAFKVPEEITVASWPRHARYGARGGQPNPSFLNAEMFTRHFASLLMPYRDRVANLIFEFGTFNKSTFATPGDFLGRLEPFLKKLPEGFRYSVEIRNPEYLIPDYLNVLRECNVAHVFSSWTRMPALDDQAQLETAFTADFSVVRALLKPGRAYEQAVQAFEPYRLVQEPNEGAREGLRKVAERSLERKKPAFLYVNNRLEGHAPGTIDAVTSALELSRTRL